MARVKCKSCGREFPVLRPDSSLNLSNATVRIQNQDVNVNSIRFGPGGGIEFGPGGRIVFGAPGLAKYRCPICGTESEYAEREIMV